MEEGRRWYAGKESGEEVNRKKMNKKIPGRRGRRKRCKIHCGGGTGKGAPWGGTGKGRTGVLGEELSLVIEHLCEVLGCWARKCR